MFVQHMTHVSAICNSTQRSRLLLAQEPDRQLLNRNANLYAQCYFFPIHVYNK